LGGKSESLKFQLRIGSFVSFSSMFAASEPFGYLALTAVGLLFSEDLFWRSLKYLIGVQR